MVTKSKTVVKLVLFFLFLIGISLNALIFLEGEFSLFGILRSDPTQKDNQDWLEASKKSVVLVSVRLGEGVGTGTGFVVKPGFVATNAHVILCEQEGSEEKALPESINITQNGITTSAKLVGIQYSKGLPAEDMAILEISDKSIPALRLARSSDYQVDHDGDEVLSIGYPLVGMVSEADKATISGKGTISTFRDKQDVFITSGTDINAGNSGGPVFLVETGEVLGIAKGVIRGNVLDEDGEEKKSADVAGVDLVIPIDRFKNFFFTQTGEELCQPSNN